MLNVFGSKPALGCSGPLSRRTALQVGGLVGCGLSLVDSFRARAAVNGAGPVPPRSVIQILLAGGPSQFETFDPKPLAPLEIRGPHAPISTANSGLQICETLPGLAAQAERFSLIRSCCHDNPGHGGGQRYVLTGHKPVALENELPHDFPAVGAITSRVRGPIHNGMPTFVLLGPQVDGDPAFLGSTYRPLYVYSENGKPAGMELTPRIELSQVEDRRRLRQAFDKLHRAADSGAAMDSLDALEQQAFDVLSRTAVREAFDLSQEPLAMRQRYGSHEAGRSCLLARRFVEAGAGFVTIRMGQWDHHGNAGGTITSGAKEHCPPMDQAVSTLIADLFERGLDERVLVLVWGEFGRTPRINQFAGRDHWPQAMSVLVSGGGLRMGQVVGATNSKGEHPQDRALSPMDVLATVYHQLGIDPSRSFTNRAGRPIPILGQGAVIRELT